MRKLFLIVLLAFCFSQPDIVGCTDPSAITCEEYLAPFSPFSNLLCEYESSWEFYSGCEPCINGIPCEGCYNPEATIDNGQCIYVALPSDDEFIITEQYSDDGDLIGLHIDWSSFLQPGNVIGYGLTRSCNLYFSGEQRCYDLIRYGDNYLDTEYYDYFDVVSWIAEHNEEGTESDFHGGVQYLFYIYYENNNPITVHDFYYHWLDNDYCEYLGHAGDINNDGMMNVIDVVNLVHYILNNNNLIDICFALADVNNDDFVNVIDIVTIIYWILSLQ